jgi:hypothetical protein
VPALEDAGYILRLPEIERYLLLRDRLREDAEDRRLYARTKRDLASRSWPSMDHYAEAKTEVVEGIIARAADVGGVESVPLHIATLELSRTPLAEVDCVLHRSVQQPCSNPSKSPESSGKASHKKYACLQLFCKLRKGAANFLAAFARRRSVVRTQHRPLLPNGSPASHAIQTTHRVSASPS